MNLLLAQQSPSVPAIPWADLSPTLMLVGGALTLLLFGALTPRWPTGAYAWGTAAVASVAGSLAMWRWFQIESADPLAEVSRGAQPLLNRAIVIDPLALFLTIAVCVAVVLVALLSNGTIETATTQSPEPYGLFLLASAGAVVMVAANDLIVLFLGLETLSLALYVLAASDRRRRSSQEAGFKYFVLGGFASAILLYGIALIYGASTSTRLVEILSTFSTAAPAGGRDALLLAGTALVVVGLAFKIAAVPFHFWQPDVYEGAPATVTGLMASVGKIGAFAAAVRVLVIALPFERDDWVPVVWFLAVASLVVGAVLAVAQTNVKRMLAYSSINHAGFMLVALVAAGVRAGERANPGPGLSALTTYLALYAVLVVGTFGVVGVMTHSRGGDASLESFRGVARRQPVLGVLLSLFLLAQAGVPLTSGFTAKFGAIRAAVVEERYALAIIAMVSSVVAAYLYLRIIVSVWFASDESSDQARAEVTTSAWVALGLAAATTVVFGLFPSAIIDVADKVTQYVL